MMMMMSFHYEVISDCTYTSAWLCKCFIVLFLKTPEELDVLRAVSTAIRCRDYAAVELYLSEGGNPNGFYGMTLLGKTLYLSLFDIKLVEHWISLATKLPVYVAITSKFTKNFTLNGAETIQYAEDESSK